MCLAVPMRIESIDADGLGTAHLGGTNHKVNLSLLESVAVGDYVIIHAGFAIEKLDQVEADERMKLFAEMAEKWKESGGEIH